MSYWTFTDIFEENRPRLASFYGSFGLINYQGIKKPSYFAYKCLAQLKAKDISTNDPHSWATKGDDGSVQVLVWNYNRVVPPNEEHGQTFFKREQPAVSGGTTTVHIAGLKAGLYL